MKPEDKITHAIISGEVHRNYLEQVSHTRHWEKSTKQKGNLFLKELKKNTKYFEILEGHVEDSTLDVHDVFYDYVGELSEIPIWDMGEAQAVLKAFKKDKKSILGIAKKILK